jgi:hypothetical protein
MGYSPTLAGAGRYTRAEAETIVTHANYPPGTCHECAIPVVALDGVEDLARTIDEPPADIGRLSPDEHLMLQQYRTFPELSRAAVRQLFNALTDDP